jgi:hypothetical protein
MTKAEGFQVNMLACGGCVQLMRAAAAAGWSGNSMLDAGVHISASSNGDHGL